MKGGAAYQDWGGDGQGLSGEMRCFGGCGAHCRGFLIDADFFLMLSVDGEKVLER
jgi:hypothetical protein